MHFNSVCIEADLIQTFVLSRKLVMEIYISFKEVVFVFFLIYLIAIVNVAETCIISYMLAT